MINVSKLTLIEFNRDREWKCLSRICSIFWSHKDMLMLPMSIPEHLISSRSHEITIHSDNFWNAISIVVILLQSIFNDT